MKKFIALAFAAAPASIVGEVLKLGGPIQTTGVGSNGKAAFELWRDWVNDAANSQTYSVELHWGDSSDIATVVADMTDPARCNPVCVDVLIAPYGSGGSITAINAVHSSYTGAVLVWGGASDSIASTCAGKTFSCFQTFTKGSEYAKTGIAAVDAQSSNPLSVALIENNNGFTQSVCDGANSSIASSGGTLTLHSSTTLSEKSSVPAADMSKVDTVIAGAPDVVVICGHNGFVEPIIAQIGAAKAPPKAVIATNSITSSAITKYGANAAFADCMLMPTQWDESDANKDSIIGWTSSAFKTALGAQATYHGASAGAAGIAVTHAMNAGTEGTRVADIKSLLSNVNTPSFYGTIQFNGQGNIQKPMYTQQKQTAGNVVVAPAASKVADIKYPLATCSSWSLSNSGDTTESEQASGSIVPRASAFSIMACLPAALMFM